MALGTDGLLTVVGDVDTITDTKASGTLTVRLSDVLVVGNKRYAPIDQQVQLNPNDGTFSIKLPPVGDTGITYRFELVAYAYVNGQREHFEETKDVHLTADLGNAQGVVQYNDLAPVATPGVPQTFLTRAVADTRYLQASALELALADYVKTDDLEEVDLTPYATTESVTAALSGKASTTALTNGLSGKADAAATATALSGKADAAAVTTALNAKASTTQLSDGLAAKADATATAQAIAAKADAAAISSLLKVQAGTPDAMVVGAIVRDTNGAATGFDVVWPDGATGRFTGTASTSFPGAIDAYAITHVFGSPAVTTTYTQPAVTRNTSGAVTTRPAITVA